MARRFRSRIGRSKKEWYVVRNALGQIIDVQSVSRATRGDARKKAKRKVVRPRMGFLGDY